MLEIETKLKVESHEPIRDRLKAVGAGFISHVLERNFIFDRSDGSLRASGCGLRVREIRPLNGAQRAALLTFKGPRRSSEYKSRSEINIAVDSGIRTCEMLAALEFKEIMFFEKRRETWKLDAAQVDLDELPLL
ncbi:MAG: class IV adenylate cyclase, partial [Planctomycetota bacterium]|nr:class IV adenylate cyclase [Planctomycetota bacterium]